MRRNQATEGSAGCVRLKEADAKAIYDFAVRYKTKVWVVDRWPEHGGCISPGDFLDLILEGVHNLQTEVKRIKKLLILDEQGQ
jgi:hypothetical protein